MANCEGCSWTDSSECKKSINEINVMCDVDCFLPYPAEYFKEDPSMDAAQNFIDFHSNPDNIIETKPENIKDNFICGDNILSSEKDFPELPTREMLEELIILGNLQQDEDIPIIIEKFIDIFMITKDDASDNELENNLNNLLNTNESDKDFLNRINSYTSIEQLGENYEDLKYIERKIKKFLGTNTDDFVEIFHTHVDYNEFCIDGFSTRPMEILGNLLKLDVEGNVDEQGFLEEKRVFKMLLKYVPNLIKKVLEISEKIELYKCDRVTKKTRLYKEIYKDLFIDSNVLKFDLPDLGIMDFFKDFNRNIYTKIILLIFIGFIVSRIISLFSVNVAVKA